MDIIDAIQKQVDEVFDRKYAEHNNNDEECAVRFVVSILYEGTGDKLHHRIILTIQHAGYAFSSILFPRLDYVYGYADIEEEMERLFNRTM